jgi:putative oxygen-independent coproporphyrinogen III oxidase
VNAGLYVHVPFCRHRCHFCAFLITTHRDFVADWERAVIYEIELRARKFPESFDTIYFGGGTPSLAPAISLGRIIEAAREHLDVAEDTEVTLEANPGDLAVADLATLHDLGVNRLSLGIQSTDDGDLEFLTRHHSAREGREAFLAARAAGFQNITIDLMYGLPHRTRDQWRERLDAALDLGPDHVSAYQLTYEPGTPMRRFRDKGDFDALSMEEEGDRFRLTREWLAEAGFLQYEVSNFAREPRFESRHNWKYWEGAPYLGVGPAAHSFKGGRRWWNLGAVRNYVRAAAAGESPVEEEETLTGAQVRLETMFLGLRTTRGVAVSKLPEGLLELPRTGAYLDAGLAEVADGHLRLTPEGLAVADGIAADLGAVEINPDGNA